MFCRERIFLRHYAALALACSSFFAAALSCLGQKAPGTPEHPWDGASYTAPFAKVDSQLRTEFHISTSEVYTLPQLIDLAEKNNPQTRNAWEAAKVRAAAVGVARSDLFPTLTAEAFGQTVQDGVLLYDSFVKQILGLAQGQLRLNYTILDFNARLDRVTQERSNLLADNLGFNDVHRRLIFQVMMFYYQLLNANGQRRAAETNLANAQAVQAAAEARLQNGLATLPDVLESRSASAQAEYALQSTIGAEETSRGDLATTLMAPASSEFRIEGIEALTVPQSLDNSANDLIKKALAQRPDLQARLAEVQGAEAGVRKARTAYYPALTFQGTYGYLRAYGEQPPFAGAYARAPVYNAQLTLGWTVFDGGKRRNDLRQAEALEKQAQARAEETRDSIADEVWRSYSDTRTALRQRGAAQSLLNASQVSYNAALEAYRYGVRSILDVLSAQQALAQARSEDISAQVRVLTQFADLAYRTADLLKQKTPTAGNP